MATKKPDESDIGFVAPSDLRFDLSNPRFLDEGFTTEEPVLEYLVGAVDVDELLQSIRSAGYVDFEPLIVERASRIVLEGNRRLAALRLLSDDGLRNRLKVRLPDVPDPKPLPERIRVKWVDNRTEARAFIGFKHINGPFKWDALAKAKFAAEWFEDGGDVVTISRTLGDNHNTVRRLVNGWYALEQARDDGFDREDRSKARFAFSHLYTALTRASVREFLSLTPEDLSAPPKPDPVPAENTLMHPLILQHQITPKTSRYTRCSMSMLPNVSINGRIRSSGQLGRWWYSISPCRNSECVRRFTVFAFNQRS